LEKEEARQEVAESLAVPDMERDGWVKAESRKQKVETGKGPERKKMKMSRHHLRSTICHHLFSRSFGIKHFLRRARQECRASLGSGLFILFPNNQSQIANHFSSPRPLAENLSERVAAAALKALLHLARSGVRRR
jgi:hypothetical protein